MTKRLLAALESLGPSDPDGLVFQTPEGSPWPISTVKRYFSLAKKLAGITRKFRFHDMRHDFASALAQDGVSLYIIAKLLGHTSQRMTSRYAHLSPEDLRKAVDGLARE